MIRYAISDGVLRPGKVASWAREGIDFVQLRNKTADAGELAQRARTMMDLLSGTGTGLLVNGRVDVAVAAGAAGVHLTGAPDELTPAQVRLLMPHAVVSVSCHSLAEVERARDSRADWILFGPVFEKRVAGQVVAASVGLAALREACMLAPGKVLALGGVTVVNAELCVEAGAAGVASIRMFADDDTVGAD